ncbi:protein phosphatase 2C domain-containing protein [Gordonia aichiensis]|uniref:protein phosphatase 2C domain-containing protein n=1 Tax=Gordonia aichiensis TaxID=36820 RepID=UPI000346D3BB|nr:protein phosphatase 2C domain-containing protein [Gordonia aichiensis]
MRRGHARWCAAWTIVEQAKTTLGLEDPDRTAAARDFSTTLVVAIVDPRDDGSADVRITDVGDSGAWVLSRGGFESVIAGKSADEGGITSSAVSGLPRVPQTLQVRSVVLEPGEVLLVGTDGIGDPLGSGEGSVGNLFQGRSGRRSPITPGICQRRRLQP